MCKLDSNSSKAKRVYGIFKSNPHEVFDIRGMTNTYNQIYTDNTGTTTISTIITRLYVKNKLIRTPTQLNSGHFYSIMNQEKIDEIYRKYLLPCDFDDNEMILGLITQNKFEKLKTDAKLDFSKINDFKFIKKYGVDYFYNPKVLNFMATNLGFLMCDGHIGKHKNLARYTFNQEIDAISFKSYFNSIFPKEHLPVKYWSYCFNINLCGKPFATLFNYLGVPSGNKVFQPFLIPDWIYNGSDEIKRTFLSIIYGNEGAKPQDNRWRIQFVLSKAKRYVPNLLEFMSQVRTMLAHFGITTSHIQLRKQKGRQFCGRFYIKGKDNLLKFYNHLEFAYASEKQEVLESLLRRDNLIN
jgi:hypothetical protein